MYDSLLDASIADEIAAAEGARHSGDDRDERVVLLRQVYNNVEAQENLRRIVRELTTDAGVSLVCVEGAEGRVAPRTDATSVEAVLQTTTRVAAGVEVWLSQDQPTAELIGVDDLTAEAASRAAQAVCMENAKQRESTFAEIRRVLRAAQGRAYPPPVAELRRKQLAFYGEWDEIASGPAQYEKSLSLPLSGLLDRVGPAAAAARVDLRSYPKLAQYVRLRQREQSLNATRAAAEQREFSTRIALKLDGWMRAGTMSSEDASLLIEFWGEQQGLTLSELQSMVERQGMEQPLMQAFEFFLLWIAQRGGAAQSGAVDASTMMEEMFRAALRLRIPFFDLLELRKMIAQRREALGLNGLSFSSQLDECCQAIAGQVTTPQAAKLRDVETQLDLIYRALRMELMATDAELAELERGVLERIVDSAASIAGVATAKGKGLELLRLGALDDAVEAARRFYRGSQQRSHAMARLTLEHMRRRHADRALLVAGGFHERGITRFFEDDRRTSWSIITPQVKLNSDGS